MCELSEMRTKLRNEIMSTTKFKKKLSNTDVFKIKLPHILTSMTCNSKQNIELHISSFISMVTN